MFLKYSFEEVVLEDELILIPVGPGSETIKGVLKLNKEGKEIVDFLRKDCTEDYIVESLLSKYDNEQSVLVKYVHDTIVKLQKAGLIETKDE